MRSDPNQVTELAERVLAHIASKPYWRGNEQITLTVIIDAVPDGESNAFNRPKELTGLVDELLYKGKHFGRNRMIKKSIC
jgi:PleD family two-component response regulator